MRKTKIVCTIGPASENKDVLRELIKSGLSVMRNNFSHGDYEEHGKRINTLRELNKELGTFCGLMLDTKGPEIRTNEFDGKVLIEKGSEVRIAFKEVLGKQTGEEKGIKQYKFSVTYPGLYDDVDKGSTILIDDGYLELTVVSKDEKNKELVTVAKNSHIIKSRRGINVPGEILNMPFISEKDRSDYIFACKENYDYIAASFVRRAQDVIDIKEILKEQKAEHIQIIAKIENQEGVDNLDEIIEEADGIMVARGDLGVEVPAEEVPLIQKYIVSRCQALGKTVIVATQMLESMQKNPRPTRAEVNDVANAVYDGTDSTMLSGESAAGDYPVESVVYMAKINARAEEGVNPEFFTEQAFFESDCVDPVDMVAYGAAKSVLSLGSKVIVATGSKAAIALSKFRPAAPIITIVKDQKEGTALSVRYGIYPIIGETKLKDMLTKFGLEKNDTYIKADDTKFEIITNK